MSATLGEMDAFVATIKNATEEEKQLAFKFLIKKDALDIAQMLDL